MIQYKWCLTKNDHPYVCLRNERGEMISIMPFERHHPKANTVWYYYRVFLEHRMVPRVRGQANTDFGNLREAWRFARKVLK